MKPLRAGLIGTGYAAQKHLKALRHHPRLQWVGAVHTPRSAEQARALQAASGLPLLTTDARQLLDAVDLVYICSPNALHYAHVLAALDAGVHAVCEKPLTVQAEDAADIARRLQSSPLKLSVGMNCRFRLPYAEIARRCHNGALGRLWTVRGTYVMQSEAALASREKAWWFDPANGELLLRGGGIHMLDLLQWVAGDIIRVYAVAGRSSLEGACGADAWHVLLTFAGGVAGDLFIAWAAQRPNEMHLDVYGDRGTIVGGRMVLAEEIGRWREEALPLDTPGADLVRQTEDLLQAIEEHRQPLNHAWQAATSLRVCNAIEDSARSGCPVELEPATERAPDAVRF